MWKDDKHVFHHVSTDEVYGSLGLRVFYRRNIYDPRSPYSASKASSDHFVRAYYHTYGLPIKFELFQITESPFSRKTNSINDS